MKNYVHATYNSFISGYVELYSILIINYKSINELMRTVFVIILQETLSYVHINRQKN